MSTDYEVDALTTTVLSLSNLKKLSHKISQIGKTTIKSIYVLTIQ